MKSQLKFVQIDSFTRTPFRGNPAAVCLTPSPLPEERMQALAAELNLSETAFLSPREDGYGLRWFTPTAEVDLCGHATLAAAHFLWSEGHLGHGESAVFHTRSGRLEAKKRADHISMDFPARSVVSLEEPPEVFKKRDDVEFVGRDEHAVLVELASEEAVVRFAEDTDVLEALPTQEIIITARSENNLRDFVSRVFAPSVGIFEDPVTGAAHCMLGPYWMSKLGTTAVQGEQISHRPGVVHVEAGDKGRVILSGQAVTVMKGLFVRLP